MSEEKESVKELEVGDTITVKGHLDVSGLKDGNKYRVEAIERFKEDVTLYVLYNIDLDLQLKARKDKLDRVLETDNRVERLRLDDSSYESFLVQGF